MTSLIRKSLRRNRDVDISTKPKGSEVTVNLLDGDTRVVYVDVSGFVKIKFVNY